MTSTVGPATSPGVVEPSAARPRGPTAGDPSSARSLHHTTVVTPEGVVLEFRVAGLGSRILAKGLDLVIQFVALVVTLIVAGMAAAGSPAVGIVVVVVSIFGVFYGYPALLEAYWDGRTVGKRVFGIRVITTEGAPVGLRHAAIRSMLATLDFWVPTPGGLIALTVALLSKRSQRLGDLAAGTIVVRDGGGGAGPVYFPPAVGAETFARTLDTSRLDARQYTLVREFLLRCGELAPPARQEVGLLLADRVAEAVSAPRPPWLDPERYLLSVVHAHQSRSLGPAGVIPPPPTTRPSQPPSPPPSWQASPPSWPGSTPAPPPATPVDLRHLPPPTGPPHGIPPGYRPGPR
ncbi:MAG: RDD family protein [Acidimicrobiales bacterium]